MVLGSLAYVGFAGQFPWTVLFVYLPVISPRLGGDLFPVALMIAMGAAGNSIRFAMVVRGNSFSDSFRLRVGSLSSCVFAVGLIILNCTFSDTTNGLSSVGFWLGLAFSMFGGVGTGLVLSSGYGIASAVSGEVPVANNVFFFGQAVAAIVSWPLKSLIEQIVPSNITAQICIGFGVSALCSLAVVTVHRLGIRNKLPAPEVKAVEEKVSRVSILQKMAMPITLLWISFALTGLVSPGQVLRWSPFPESSSEFLRDPKLHQSLCMYLLILADAFGKLIPILVSLYRDLLERIIINKITIFAVGLTVVCRAGLTPLFVYSPTSLVGQFCLIIAFGLSQGVCATLCLSLGSIRAKSTPDIAGYISSFAIINGAFVGSISGMLLQVYG